MSGGIGARLRDTWAAVRQAATPEVLISCGIGFVGISAVTAIGPVLGQVQDGFVLSHALVGLVGSVFGLARLVVDLPAGRLAGRLDERALSGAGLAVLGGGSLLGAMAPSYAVVLVARVLMGIGQSVSSTSNLVWLSNTSPPRQRTTAMALYQTSIVSALSVFPLAGGLVGERYGWRAAFGVCVAAALFGLILVLLAFTRPRVIAARPERAAASAITEVFQHLDRRRALGLLGAYASVFLLMFNSVGFVGTLVPLYADDVLRLSPATIGVGLAVASVVGLAVTIPGGVWADRYGPLPILLPGFGGVVIGTLCFLVVRDAAGFVAAASVVGLYSLSSSVPATLVAVLVPADLRGPAVGLYRLTGDVGVLIGPFLLTWAVDMAGYRVAIVISAAVAAAVLLAAWRLVGPLCGERGLVECEKRGA